MQIATEQQAANVSVADTSVPSEPVAMDVDTTGTNDGRAKRKADDDATPAESSKKPRIGMGLVYQSVGSSMLI